MPVIVEQGQKMGICFEHYGYGYQAQQNIELGFTIAFNLKNSTLNRQFVAKYYARTFGYGGAFAIEAAF